MNRTVTVVTPENIEVSYQLAGFASRFMAFLVDLLVQLSLILLVQLILRVTVGVTGNAGFSAASLLSATGIIAVYLLIFAYAIFFEMLWGGRTPGKRLLGLRVIRDGGYSINLFASALRNILRFIDFGIVPISSAPLILFGLPGMASIFFSPTYKRIGDYAAGTLVIIEGGRAEGEAKRGRTESRAISPQAAAFLPFIRNLDRLTTEEYRLVRRFVSRRRQLDIPVQIALAERLARPLMQKLAILAPITFPVQYSDLLEALERRYAEEYGIL
jgi:uncharacterized RDD family membrane protein YckC